MTRWIAGDLPKDFRDSLNYRRTVEDDRRENAEKRTWLCQYTNIESLYKIISNKTIRFTRVDKVNDISEKDLLEIDNLYLRTYISCFSYDSKESIPLWSIYTKRGSGVRIDFEFLENNIQNLFIGLDKNTISEPKANEEYDFSEFRTYIHDVEYSDLPSVRPIMQKENDVFITPRAIAFQKSTEWEYEKETRITMISRLHNIEVPPYLDFLLDFSKIKSICIVFDPWMSSEIKTSIKLTVNHFMGSLSNIVNCKNSCLEGRIR